jgi:SagB-type dehydrogenase family enzyme
MMRAMGKADPAAMWLYHDATKHSVERLRQDRHVLDWGNQPLPYKLYRDLDPLPLPRDFPTSQVPTLEAIASSGAAPVIGAAAAATPAAVVPTLEDIARLLLFSAGIMRKAVYADGREMYFRAAACTGALYHIDLYLICGALPGLEPGVYHFGPQDFALRRLRAGNYRALVVEATGDEPAVAAAPAIVVSASTFWRNAWKYKARAYRHCFWDNGTILANALAVAAADGIPARLVLGFVDRTINQLIGVDGEREAALSLLAVGNDPDMRPAPAPPAPALALTTAALSAREVDYPAIRAAHAASSLASPGEARAWHGRSLVAPPQPAARSAIALRSLAALPAGGIDGVIRRRGSTRRFARQSIAFEELSTLLLHATVDIAADFLTAPGAHLSDLYLIVNAVEGMAAGAYVYHPSPPSLECLRAGDFRREAGLLDLGQDLAADASVNCYLLSDLRPALARLGNRGYRAAQLEAAIRGGRLYLGAYALGLGASGLTFFDDAVTEFFSPHADGKSVMFLVAVGRGPRRKVPVTG